MAASGEVAAKFERVVAPRPGTNPMRGSARIAVRPLRATPRHRRLCHAARHELKSHR
jgi:hypothetical protein